MAATLVERESGVQMGKLGRSNLLCARDPERRGLAASQSVSRGQNRGPYAALSLLSPSLLPHPSVRGHFNDEHVLNSFVYLATAFLRGGLN